MSTRQTGAPHTAAMTGPVPLPRQYPAHLQLCYRGVRYRPAALQLFVARGGWGPEYMAAPRRTCLNDASLPARP